MDGTESFFQSIVFNGNMRWWKNDMNFFNYALVQSNIDENNSSFLILS